ncbi:MAG: leucine--tRNA ligase [Candidatus Micrarchaeota archaeon]|nr:leucine--tRNA ligase [Candidatus Micrarchaeota archaeon]
MIDYSSIEKKWQAEWEKARIFEPEPSDKKPFMVTAAFPYVNTALHIGHLRTYGTADALARYKRMRGYNVLYPMGFHATGTPILAFAKRIQKGDSELIRELKIFHIPDDEIKKMVTPEYIAEYFVKTVEKDMRTSGLSVDWRRKLVSIEPIFGKFIEWQFKILNEKGYLTKGKHPVGWCPNENNAVGMHDTQHDVEPEIEEETAIKFKVDGEDASFICSTYRPETLDGVTNIFVNEGSTYVLCRMDGENFYVSKSAANILSYQRSVEVARELPGKELLAKKAINPFNNEVVPVFPGYFVKESLGTGVVMSVPAHAPFDYAAIERLKASGYNTGEVRYKRIIDVQIGRSLSDVSVGEAKPVHVDLPSLAYLEVLHTDVNAIDDMLEFATKLQYREESHWGKMLVKGYEGMSEPEARDKIKKQMVDSGKAIMIYIVQNAPVKCRCGYDVVVKIVDNQWFLNYGDPKWKEMVKQNFEQMRILPPKARNGFAAAIDWIDLRAVARSQGLGTRLPVDKSVIIESLSDSTIYPAFYTIVSLIRSVDVEKLRPEFFDYVYLGKGGVDEVAKTTGIEYETIKRCRDSFAYWYQETSRHSGPDLIFNHLTMYMFNHTAIFDKAYWPKQIVVNGMVMSEGEKMSKSLGNIIPLVDGAERIGIDPLRIVETTSADLLSDSEYSESSVNGVKERLEYLKSVIDNIAGYESGEFKHIDYWLYSKINRKIERATAAMDALELRDYATDVLYNSIIELKRYFDRGGSNGTVLREYLQNVALMLQPVAPHISEELHHSLGNEGFAALEKWPIPDSSMISEKVESEEELVTASLDDIKRAWELVTKKSPDKRPSRVSLVVASDWKRRAHGELAKSKDVGKTIASLRADGVSPEAAAKYVGKIAKEMNRLREVSTTEEDEFKALGEAKGYLEKALGAEVAVEMESKSKSARAERAAPLKPSIEIIF